MMRRRSPERMLLKSTEAVPDIVAQLNKFAEQSTLVVESLLRSTEFVDVIVTASPDLFIVRRDAGEHVASVSVAKVQDIERPQDPVMITSIFWSFIGNDIQAKLDGLTAGRRYNLRFKIVRNEG